MIPDKAEELGRLIGQSDEYRALLRARTVVEEERELRGKLERLEQLAQALERRVAEGEEPTREDADTYERLLGEIQADPRYQQLVAAQSNFDKLMLRVNEQIVAGMKVGAESRIITLS